MDPTGDHPSNPFSDPTYAAEQRSLVDESTLSVGRNASLTLGAESLIVLDEGFVEEPRFNCFGLIPTKSKKTRAVPYYNILWAEITKVEITIHYATPLGNKNVRAAYINYQLDQSILDILDLAKKWTEKLLDRAYGKAQRNKRLKVLVNPKGGKGNASKLFTRDIEPIFAAARCTLDVEVTKYSGHGTDIAKDIDVDAYDAIACCSGDGLPYEVFNGLGRKSNAAEALSKLAVCNLPCGSGNAMSWNLNGTGSPSMAALCVVKGLRMPMDLVSVSQGERRYLSFLSQAIGIVAESDLGTDNIRWMGPARFTFGFLVRLLGKTTYPCDVAYKIEIADKSNIKDHYHSAVSSSSEIGSDSNQIPITSRSGLPPLKYGTTTSSLSSGWTPLTPFPNLGNLYTGNMCFMAPEAPFFPCALPTDGYLDMVQIDGTIPRYTSFKLMLSVEKGTLMDQEPVNYRKISAYRVIPRFEGGYISVDGEVIPFEEFQCEVHKGLGTVLSKNGRTYESEGPKERRLS